MTSRHTAEADDRFREWMRGNLERAAEHFGVRVTGSPVLGWSMLSIGAAVRGPAGKGWLRVVTELPRWASGDTWTGNTEANALTDVAKPQVLDAFEWQDQPAGGRWQRAELMTLVPGHPCSPTDAVRHQLTLSPRWWTILRASLDSLAAQSTERVTVTQQDVSRRLLAFFGDRIDPTVTNWTTAHGDLHWANLMQPECVIVDWQHWGIAPSGYDAATLHCYSLLTPAVAATVHQVFADLLDTPDGIRAQLHVIGRLLGRVDGGDYPELAAPLPALAGRLLDRSSV